MQFPALASTAAGKDLVIYLKIYRTLLANGLQFIYRAFVQNLGY